MFEARVLAVFALLTRAAKERRLVTYVELAEGVKCHHHAELARLLDCIADLCKDHEYPPLTALAISQENLLPGKGIWTLFPEIQEGEKDRRWAEMVREVYLFDWGKVPRKLFDSEDENR